MPTPLDIVFASLFSIAIVVIGGAYVDRRFKGQLAAGVPNARLNWYRLTLVGEWVLAAMTLALWSKEGRPWRALGLVPPGDWRLYVGLGLAIGIGVMLVRQNGRVRALPPDRLQRLAPKFADVVFIIPRSAREYRWFQAVSWTAGVCEELLYRGFLTWIVAAYAGAAAALVIVSLAFGSGHAYQGRKGVLKTAAVGFVLGCVVLLGGWLIPAMFIHGVVDSSSGVAGFAVLRHGDGRLAPD